MKIKLCKNCSAEYSSKSVYCENCRKIYVANYKKQNKTLHPDKVIKDRIKHYSKLENIKKKKQKDKLYYLNNTEKIRKKQTLWVKNNPKQNLKHRISHMVRIALSKGGFTKGGSTFQHLNYSPEDLKIHLENLFEPWMNWNNHGIYRSSTWNDQDSSTWTWQIDHIIPQSQLPYDSMEHHNFKKCWDLTNLRPLSAKLNVLRKDKPLENFDNC